MCKFLLTHEAEDELVAISSFFFSLSPVSEEALEVLWNVTDDRAGPHLESLASDV